MMQSVQVSQTYQQTLYWGKDIYRLSDITNPKEIDIRYVARVTCVSVCLLCAYGVRGVCGVWCGVCMCVFMCSVITFDALSGALVSFWVNYCCSANHWKILEISILVCLFEFFLQKAFRSVNGVNKKSTLPTFSCFLFQFLFSLSKNRWCHCSRSTITFATSHNTFLLHHPYNTVLLS